MPRIAPDWRSRAACADTDPELFFPVGVGRSATAQIREAKRVCFSCPVRDDCLEWALETGQIDGVWGAMDETARRRLQRRRRKTQVA